VAEYIDLDLVSDTDALANVAFSYLEGAIPNWVARPANVETVMLEADAQMLSEVLDQASQVPPAVYATIGQTIYGIPRLAATSAVATATITWAADTPAVMLDARSQVIVPNPSGDAQVFLTDDDVVAIEGGGESRVGVTAELPGAAANGSFGDSELATALDGVDSIQVSEAQGGTDEEDIDDYLDRLTSALTLLAPRPILPQDHATLALQVPGVGRALAIDLYMPPASESPVGDTDAPEYNSAGGSNVPRCTTVAITGPGGAAPDVGLMQRVYESLDAQREVNFLNYVIGPTYATIGVRATVTAFPGFALADVEAAAEAMMRSWLDPGQFGTLPGAAETTSWARDTKVRLYEAVDYLNRANGVHWVDSVELTANGGSSWQAADIALSGAAPLPMPDDANILITAQAAP
jgi:hypothetical protein